MCDYCYFILNSCLNVLNSVDVAEIMMLERKMGVEGQRCSQRVFTACFIRMLGLEILENVINVILRSIIYASILLKLF